MLPEHSRELRKAGFLAGDELDQPPEQFRVVLTCVQARDFMAGPRHLVVHDAILEVTAEGGGTKGRRNGHGAMGLGPQTVELARRLLMLGVSNCGPVRSANAHYDGSIFAPNPFDSEP